MAQKVPVSIEEVARHSVAPYTIYNKDGSILCYKGIVFTPQLLSRLSMQQMFKTPDLYKDEGGGSGSGGIVSKISKETSSYLIGMTKSFLTAAEKGDKPAVNTFFNARDRILDEVKQHISKIQHIGELRIYYDDYDLSHGINVATLSTALAIKMDYEDEELKELTLGALLHDIGKTKLPRQIVQKPDKLTPKEFEIMKLHSPLGFRIIKDEYGLPNRVALSALDHQEHYDGSGYTRKLQADKIFKYAQIIRIADTYDAAASNKVYARAKSPKEIVKEILKTSRLYNPRILYTLVHLVNYNTGALKEKLVSDKK